MVIDSLLKPILGSIGSMLGMRIFTGKNAFADYIRGTTGSGLTSAQVEQNQWNAGQAEVAFNRDLQADSTKYQRQTADMQSAGLNPAMMYGDSVSGAGSVSAPMASGTDPGTPSAGLIDSLINVAFAKQRMSLMQAEQRNIDADTELKGSQTILNEKNVPVIEQTLENMKADKALTEEQTKQVSKVLEWFDREKQASIDVMKSQSNLFDWEAQVASRKFRNLDTEQQKMLQEITNLRQEVCESLSRIALNNQSALTAGALASLYDEQVKEIEPKIRMLTEMTGKLSADAKLTTRDFNWYWVNHGLAPIVNGALGIATAGVGAGLFSPARSVISGFR